MTDNMVDRTRELEERLRILYVNSEDTCAFWSKRKDTLIGIKRCFFCAYYCPRNENDKTGSCSFKRCNPENQTEIERR